MPNRNATPNAWDLPSGIDPVHLLCRRVIELCEYSDFDVVINGVNALDDSKRAHPARK
jgi:hypothetical protein